MKRPEALQAGLDIGSAVIRLAVGGWRENPAEAARPEFRILGAAEVPASGVQRGTISSIEEVVSAISAVLERAERIVGVPIESAVVGVSGLHILSQTSKGVVAVSKADSEISEADVERAIEASRAIATPLNYEVLHVIPKIFSIDSQTAVRDPVGMTGIRLEVDTQIILGSTAQIKNLTKTVYRTGLGIDELVLSILATAEAVTTARQRDIGVLTVNIGLATTSLIVYEEGNMVHLAILPLGSEHITNDIAIGLRTSLDVAEAVKIEYGDCRPEVIGRREEVDLLELGAADHEIIKRVYVSEIIEARLEEILRKVDGELQRCKRSGLLPAGVIFTGGGAKLPGLLELGKRVLRLPAVLGYPLQIMSVTDKVNDLGFSTAVGLVKWGSGSAAGVQRGFPGRRPRIFRTMATASAQLKRFMKALIP